MSHTIRQYIHYSRQRCCVFASVSLLVGSLDWEQNYAKSTEQIPIKLRWRMDFIPEWTPLTFGTDLDKVLDQGSFFLLHFCTFLRE